MTEFEKKCVERILVAELKHGSLVPSSRSVTEGIATRFLYRLLLRNR